MHTDLKYQDEIVFHPYASVRIVIGILAMASLFCVVSLLLVCE